MFGSYPGSPHPLCFLYVCPVSLTQTSAISCGNIPLRTPCLQSRAARLVESAADAWWRTLELARCLLNWSRIPTAVEQLRIGERCRLVRVYANGRNFLRMYVKWTLDRATKEKWSLNLVWPVILFLCGSKYITAACCLGSVTFVLDIGAFRAIPWRPQCSTWVTLRLSWNRTCFVKWLVNI
jgi:hypothetical protein